jgi:hypothetical protein
MPDTLWARWVRGLGFSIYAAILLAIAWGIPQAVGQLLDESRGISDSLRTTLGVLWAGAMLVFCPLAFEWLTRKLGITMDNRQTASLPRDLQGPRVATIPVNPGHKKCSGCGAIVNVYAVRCHECKAVFAEPSGASGRDEPDHPHDLPH